MGTEYLTAAELGHRLRLSTETIRQMARDGRIPCIRLSPKAIRFDPNAVADVLRRAGRTEQEGGPTNVG